MSFNANAHGTALQLHDQAGEASAPVTRYAGGLTTDSQFNLQALQHKLNQKLGPEYLSTRPGGGGSKLTYTAGWQIINLANEVFGFNGWSTNVISLTVDFCDETKSGRFSTGVTSIMRVTLRDGAFHEDIGYGQADNMPNKGQALDKAKKEAVTDGMKRALRHFGNVVGNCLYDKSYTDRVAKM
ncbi:Rad52/22 family double-strand break repair protein-domain-containing protein, partial [Schizophyllum commune]